MVVSVAVVSAAAAVVSAAAAVVSAAAAVVVQDPYYMGHEGMNQMMYWLTSQKDLIVKDIKKPPTICTLKNASDYDNNPAVITK